jgi:hypothetical protein
VRQYLAARGVFGTFEYAFITCQSVHFMVSYYFIAQFCCELCVRETAVFDVIMLLRKTINEERFCGQVKSKFGVHTEFWSGGGGGGGRAVFYDTVSRKLQTIASVVDDSMSMKHGE